MGDAKIDFGLTKFSWFIIFLTKRNAGTSDFQVVTVQPSLFLEAAYASNDSQHLASVLRFFSDFMPGFKNTSDHVTYGEILRQMNAPCVGAA